MSATAYEVSHLPRTGATEAGPPCSTQSEVADRVAAAAAAAAAVRDASPQQRASWLVAIAGALEEHAPELVALADEETALGSSPRLEGELERAAVNVRYYASVGVRGDWRGEVRQELPGPPPAQLRRLNVPLGPVAVFGASNFPFQFGVLGHDTCSALAAGCPVVAKAHPAHPRLSVRLAELATAALSLAGAPDGAYSVVVGFDAGVVLVDSPDIQAVGFTGSVRGGMALVERARRRPRPIPVFAEMGTVNPVLVTSAAAAGMDDVAGELVAAMTLGAGQFCTKPGLFLTPRGAGGPEAIADVAARTEGVWLLSDGIASAYADGIADMERAGAEVLARGGDRPEGFAARPTVLCVSEDDLVPGSRLLDECFGPVALVAEYDDLSEALSVIGRMHPSLVGGVYAGGEDDPELPAVVAALAAQVGRVVVNGATTGVACADAMHHGGPWPSTSNAATTSVGAHALTRFTRPVAFQNVPDSSLPPGLRTAAPSSETLG